MFYDWSSYFILTLSVNLVTNLQIRVNFVINSLYLTKKSLIGEQQNIMLKEGYTMNDIPKIFIMIAISIKYRNPV